MVPDSVDAPEIVVAQLHLVWLNESLNQEALELLNEHFDQVLLLQVNVYLDDVP